MPLIVHQLLCQRDTEVFVPRVDSSHPESMRMLRVVDVPQLEAFPVNRWGIPEPSEEQAASMHDALNPETGRGACVRTWCVRRVWVEGCVRARGWWCVATIPTSSVRLPLSLDRSAHRTCIDDDARPPNTVLILVETASLH